MVCVCSIASDSPVCGCCIMAGVHCLTCVGLETVRYLTTYMQYKDGYYFTGDGAYRDKDGYYWITGRVDGEAPTGPRGAALLPSMVFALLVFTVCVCVCVCVCVRVCVPSHPYPCRMLLPQMSSMSADTGLAVRRSRAHWWRTTQSQRPR